MIFLYRWYRTQQSDHVVLNPDGNNTHKIDLFKDGTRIVLVSKTHLTNWTDTQGEHFTKDTNGASPNRKSLVNHHRLFLTSHTASIEKSSEERAIQEDLLSEQQDAPQQQASNTDNVHVDADTNTEGMVADHNNAFSHPDSRNHV